MFLPGRTHWPVIERQFTRTKWREVDDLTLRLKLILVEEAIERVDDLFALPDMKQLAVACIAGYVTRMTAKKCAKMNFLVLDRPARVFDFCCNETEEDWKSHLRELIKFVL